MRLRVGGWRVGGEPASVAVVVEGEAWALAGSAVLSAESLAAEERVTLGDMGKSLLGSRRKAERDTMITSGKGAAGGC